MLELIGSLVGAGTRLLGGILGQSSADKQAAANRQAQLDFAQHGVTWKAQDATAAQEATGINRLALLGVPTNSFSNVVGSTSLADSIGGAGQDLGRAIAAGTDKDSRAQQLNEKLFEAKIANVNADTIRLQAGASALMRNAAQPGTAPGIPLPPEDPRGPVIPLMQRARDPRTGEIVWIPSEKAASPLQTLAASPINAGLAGKTIGEVLSGESRPFIPEGGGFIAPGHVERDMNNFGFVYGAP